MALNIGYPKTLVSFPVFIFVVERSPIDDASTDTDPDNVVKCSGQEDPNCSDSIPSTGINDAHLRYFGQGESDVQYFKTILLIVILTLALSTSNCS